MKLEHGRISSTQLIILFIGITLSSSSIVGVGSQVGASAWISVLLGGLEGGVFIWVFSALSARFQDRTFVEISELVFGQYLGKAVALLYLWFLFHIGSLIVFDFSEFLMSLFLRGTPKVVLAIALLLVSASAVRNGVEVIVRCAQILVPLFLLQMVLTVLISVPNIDMDNFRPVLAVPPKEILMTAHRIALFPFAQSIVLIMVTPFMTQHTKAPRVFFTALGATIIMELVFVFRNVGVLGATSRLTSYPSLVAVRLITIGEVFTRMEILIGLAIVTMGFLAVSTMLYGVALGASQILGLKSYLPLVTPIAVLMLILSLNNYSNVTQSFESIRIVNPVYHPIFEVVIPLLTLIVAVVRGLPKQKPE